MKRKILLGIIIGLVLGSTTSILATNYVTDASKVSYKNTNIQDAIEELYGMAKAGSNETLPVGEVDINGQVITIPYTGTYPIIRCIYGTDENYGNLGTLENSTCTFTGTSANQKLYYKLMALDDSGKIYEYSGYVTTGSISPLSIVNLGDYIYLKPESTSYSISGGGYATTQTINPSQLTVWRVIRKNSDGTVDIISDKVSPETVYFTGSVGYGYLVQNLNIIAAQYTDNTNSSLSVVKSTRHMGYDGQTEAAYCGDYSSSSSCPYYNAYTTSSYTTSSEEAQGLGDMGYVTDVNLVSAVYGNINKDSYGNNQNNWLASRYLRVNRTECCTYYYLVGRSTAALEGSYSESLAYSMSSAGEKTQGYAIRPILTLKSNVKIVGGTGVSGDEYQLGL